MGEHGEVLRGVESRDVDPVLRSGVTQSVSCPYLGKASPGPLDKENEYGQTRLGVCGWRPLLWVCVSVTPDMAQAFHACGGM